jgi:hypothetical protein
VHGKKISGSHGRFTTISSAIHRGFANSGLRKARKDSSRKEVQRVDTDKWKATLDWYKQLTTVDGVAAGAIAAFLTFAGRGTNIVQLPTVIFAYLAIFVFLASVGMSVLAMFQLINDIAPDSPDDVRVFLENKRHILSPFYYFVAGLVLFIVAVFLHFGSFVL